MEAWLDKVWGRTESGTPVLNSVKLRDRLGIQGIGVRSLVAGTGRGNIVKLKDRRGIQGIGFRVLAARYKPE